MSLSHQTPPDALNRLYITPFTLPSHLIRLPASLDDVTIDRSTPSVHFEIVHLDNGVEAPGVYIAW